MPPVRSRVAGNAHEASDDEHVHSRPHRAHPLVQLKNVGRGLPVPVLAKCEHMNPGGSVKDRIALAIVDDAERRGVLCPGDTLVEATAGNTGMGLALVAGVRGYTLVCVMPEKMSVDKRTALAALGAKVIITPNAPPDSAENFQNVARRMAHESGWFLTDQFCNVANVRAHMESTGPEILAQTNGRVGAFVAGAGTGGTITGVGEGIGTSKPPDILDRSVIDDAEGVTDDESFAMTRRLWMEEGLFVGGSAGTAVVAALRVASRGTVREPVVVLLPDSWDRYLSKPWAGKGSA